MWYLYHQYCSSLISNQRNVEHTQVSDIQILALLCLQMTTNMQAQRKFFAWAKLFIPNQVTFDRTRFNRRAHQLLPVASWFNSGVCANWVNRNH